MKILEVICSKCGKPKLINWWELKNNKSGIFFCSKECGFLYKKATNEKNRIIVNCEVCNKQISKTKSLYNRNKTKTFYCKECYRGRKIEVKCSNCNKTKKICKSELNKDKNHFCNKSCYDQFQRGCKENPIVQCSNCGKSKEVTPYEKDKYENHFCNIKCHDQWQNGRNAGTDNPRYNRIEKECALCGKTLSLQPCEIKENNFCNMTHRSQWASENMSGEDSPLWKGGWRRSDYGPEFNKNNKKIIKQRDNNCCSVCGISNTKRKMAVHHIDYDKKNNLWTKSLDDEDWRLNNLITVCWSCHGKMNGNRKFWENWFRSTSGFWFATLSSF